MRRRTDQYWAYLASLALFFAAAENALPRPLPFFKLGLSNIALLLALSRLNFKDYLKLVFSKWLLSSLISGTLLSPFVLMSLASNLSSALVMYIIYHLLYPRLSLYSISALGATASALSQLAVSSLILSSSVFNLTTAMVLLSLASSLFTAFVAYRLRLPEKVPSLEVAEGTKVSNVALSLYLVAIILCCFTSSSFALAICFVLALALCLSCKRKIMWSIYLFSFLSILIFNLLTPSGKVLFLFVTEGALAQGVRRGLYIITLVSISQSFAALRFCPSSFFSAIIARASAFSYAFSLTSGPIADRITDTLALKEIENIPKSENKVPSVILICLLLAIIAVCIISIVH